MGNLWNRPYITGDWLAVRAVNTKINRGEIVVVTQPNKLNEPIIKRVIAVAGDTVDIDFRTGKVTVNGVVSDEPYIAGKNREIICTSFVDCSAKLCFCDG